MEVGFDLVIGGVDVCIVVDIVLTTASLLPLATAQQIANLANGRPEVDDDDDDDDGRRP